MSSPFYHRLKEHLPPRIRNFLSGLNQMFFARQTLRRKYGSWFEVDWRKKFRNLSNDEWKRAYDTAWQHRRNDCVEETDTALFLESLRDDRTILDVGCGIGTLAMALAEAGHRIIGVDVSAEALRQAGVSSRERHLSIEWKEGFAEHLPFPDKSVDAIVCAHTLEHVKDLEKVAAEFRRVARKKILVLTPKQEYKIYMDNYHTQFFDTQKKLVEVFGLTRYQCTEIDCADHKNEFQGKAWFYVGSLDG